MVDQLREMTNCDGRYEECRHVENYPPDPKQLETFGTGVETIYESVTRGTFRNDGPVGLYASG